jgi:peptidoglycan/xylan/chitin deacetylase (PgdA/CDA1 family)
MTADEIASLSRHELIDIGSHTVTHRSLNGLARDSQESELRQSKADLQALCGRTIESFAYPNGRISGEAPKLLRDLGFSCGLTSDFGTVSRRNNPYLLPRIFVDDWDGDQFSTCLNRWLG